MVLLVLSCSLVFDISLSLEVEGGVKGWDCGRMVMFHQMRIIDISFPLHDFCPYHLETGFMGWSVDGCLNLEIKSVLG